MQSTKDYFISHDSLQNQLQRNTRPTGQATLHWERQDEQLCLRGLIVLKKLWGSERGLMSAWGNGMHASSVSPLADKGSRLHRFGVHSMQKWLQEDGTSLSEIGGKPIHFPKHFLWPSKWQWRAQSISLSASCNRAQGKDHQVNPTLIISQTGRRVAVKLLRTTAGLICWALKGLLYVWKLSCYLHRAALCHEDSPAC